jgi:ATP-dependent helicase HrpA
LTLTVPLALLNRLDAARLSWLVPGMVREKVVWYLKALPKGWRGRLPPAPEVVTAFVEQPQDPRPLRTVLRAFVAGRLGAALPAEVWEGAVPPPHLRFNLRVVDAAGRELAAGRDLGALRAQLGDAAQLDFAAAGPGLERKGIRSWDFGDLPETLVVERGGHRLSGFPALVRDGDTVALKLLDTREAAEAATRAAVIALMKIPLKDALRRWEKGGSGFVQAALVLKPALATEGLLADVLSAVCDRAFLGDDALPRSERAFAEQVKRARVRLPAVAESAFALLASIAAAYHALAQRLAAVPSAARRLAVDVTAQRDLLIAPGFFAATPWKALVHLPRYLQALERRLVKYPDNPARDVRQAQAVAALWERYREREVALRERGRHDPGLDAFRWLLEELKVSLFAQELRTPVPVSYKRLEKAWKAVSGG